MRNWWVYAEDLVGALIGPFNDVEGCLAHIRFCRGRGDAAQMAYYECVDGVFVDDCGHPITFDGVYRMTQEEDLRFDVEAVIQRLKAAGRIRNKNWDVEM